MNNSVATPAKKSLVERAIAFLKGGDDAKLLRFETKLGKYFKEQHAIRDRKIEQLRDKITDAQETFTESVPNIDLDRISKAESLEAYIPTYVSSLDSKLQVIEDLEEQISVLVAEKDRLTAIEESIYKA